MFRLDLKYRWRCNCWTSARSRKQMRVKISCSVVYSKPQNSIWIKSYAVSTDGLFWLYCLTELSRTVRNWRRRAYRKSGKEIGHEHLRTVRHVEFRVLKYLVRYLTDVRSPYCISVVNGRKNMKYGMKQRSSFKIRGLYRLLQAIPVNYIQFTTWTQNGRGSD